jgi:cell division protein FtsN
MLGLIVGIIIGLAAALIVAMYVAKVPIPFVNNAPVPGNGQGSAEDQKNLNWNPNATLQTHGPALPASGAGSAASGAQTGSAPPQQSVAVPPPTEVAAPPLPKPSATSTRAQSQAQPESRAMEHPAQAGNGEAASGDMLGDFAAARAKAADNRNGNASPAASQASFTYFVQTGAFRTAQDADAERARLSLLGMDAAITERDQAGRPVYRVRVGPFQNKAAADQISVRLSDNGFEAALVRVPR